MKRRRIGKFIFSAVIFYFACHFVFLSEARAAGLKYDFSYLFSWTAAELKINVDPRKPRPKLEFIDGEALQRMIERKTGRKYRYVSDDGTIQVNIYFSGYYNPGEIKIYVATDEDVIKDVSLVHELVHYFQHVYMGFAENSREREDEAKRLEKKFCARHGLCAPD